MRVERLRMALRGLCRQSGQGIAKGVKRTYWDNAGFYGYVRNISIFQDIWCVGVYVHFILIYQDKTRRVTSYEVMSDLYRYILIHKTGILGS
jgi:hypothetical protein